uniref:Uncharacterized protein n=1 Tax=Brassica oleracea TaxID=3712 RepID=A0A3P6H7E0_BRAOL|nr:unnamed protein product [Brassica oleracea]
MPVTPEEPIRRDYAVTAVFGVKAQAREYSCAPITSMSCWTAGCCFLPVHC